MIRFGNHLKVCEKSGLRRIRSSSLRVGFNNNWVVKELISLELKPIFTKSDLYKRKWLDHIEEESNKH
jgi:hypothetical protein